MRRNDLRQRLKRGETVIGTMVQEVRTPSIAQILKQVGFDFFMLDMEHGAFNLETAAEIIRAARLAGIPPLVRVAGPQYELIGRILDQGAIGVMLPRVESRVEVELLVQSIKYPPLGKRGMSSDAPHSGYDFKPLAEFVQMNNEDTIAIAQIERKAAIENIDDILSTPGVDVALVGPEDLSVSLGLDEDDVQSRQRGDRGDDGGRRAPSRRLGDPHGQRRGTPGLAAQRHGHGHVLVRPRIPHGRPEQRAASIACAPANRLTADLNSRLPYLRLLLGCTADPAEAPTPSGQRGSPTRLTVPSRASKIRLKANAHAADPLAREAIFRSNSSSNGSWLWISPPASSGAGTPTSTALPRAAVLPFLWAGIRWSARLRRISRSASTSMACDEHGCRDRQ